MSDLQTTLLKDYINGKLSPSTVRYDPSFDAFTILFTDPSVETTVFYLDDHIALLYNHETDQVVGVQVEGFVRYFLPRHAELMQDLQISRCDPTRVQSALTASASKRPFVAKGRPERPKLPSAASGTRWSEFQLRPTRIQSIAIFIGASL
jgi:uncharacterized protein YuzE